MSLLSPRLYRQYVLPLDRKLSEMFPCVVYHLHGSALWAIDDLMRLPGVRGHRAEFGGGGVRRGRDLRRLEENPATQAGDHLAHVRRRFLPLAGTGATGVLGQGIIDSSVNLATWHEAERVKARGFSNMKITKIETYTVSVGWKNWLFLKVCTDAGLYGISEATINGFIRRRRRRSTNWHIRHRQRSAASQRRRPARDRDDSGRRPHPSSGHGRHGGRLLGHLGQVAGRADLPIARRQATRDAFSAMPTAGTAPNERPRAFVKAAEAVVAKGSTP